MFGQVKQAAEMGAVAVGATIYFGSEESKRQIVEVSGGLRGRPRGRPGDDHLLGAYLRNSAFNKTKDGGPDYHTAADLTGQANHLGVTIEADIIKQKLPEVAAPGFLDLSFGKTDKRVYSDLLTRAPDRHDPLPARELLHRPRGADQLGRRVRRDRPPGRRQDRRDQQARGRHGSHLRPQGLPAAGRGEGIELLNAIQDVYLSPEVTVA